MSGEPGIFDLRSILGAQIRQASGAKNYDPTSVNLPANLIEIRLRAADAAVLSAHLGRLTVENERLREQLTAWLCVCPQGYPADFNPDAECQVHGDPRVPGVSMRGLLAWRAAFEQLHARLLRDLPGDASELPPPDDEFWAEQLDNLALFSAELYERANRPGPGPVPAATDKQGG